jgi:hypothetical protein
LRFLAVAAAVMPFDQARCRRLPQADGLDDGAFFQGS